MTASATGSCHALFAYDIALAIRLDTAASICRQETEREVLSGKRRTPASFQYQPTPLKIIQHDAALTVAGMPVSPRVELTMFDFGAVSVAYQIPLSCPLEQLLSLSDELYENKSLLEDSRRRVADLMWSMRDALDKPHIADFVEDYAIFQLDAVEPTPASPGSLLESNRELLARILRSERGPLSEDEVRDALASRISYAPGETAVIDWNASLLLLQSDAADVRAILEYANVELLELRHLDTQLDTILDRSYVELSRPERAWRFVLPPGRAIRRIAALQMDSALLFEGVNNALKLIGDQYLARLYRIAGDRLHLPEWDASILRKLETAESIYEKLTDRQNTRRMEALEWIVIILIAFEIVMAFIR